MTTVDAPVMARAAAPPAVAGRAWRAFRAILWRDLYVTGKEFWVLLVQVALTPLFMLFIFAKVLVNQGSVSPTYGHDLLLPGIVALSAFLTALQGIAFPLIMEFGWTREIEDRLLAPLPTGLVAVEKLVIATLRGLAAALIVYPVGALVLGSAPWRPAGLPLLLVAVLLGAWVGAGIGLTLGAIVPAGRITILFAVVVTPLLFTGATQYAWPLLNGIRWFQVVTAANPLTYCAETVRAAMVPAVPHIRPGVSVAVLLAAAAVFTGAGLITFGRRAAS
ncbi:MAG: type transport system permease protein [Mycobacteriales bacterium]|jgi:ABC-2 type transport system permease protein